MTLEERLLAYLDNELSPQDRAAFETEMTTNTWLAEEVAKHRGLAAKIAAAKANAAAGKERASGRRPAPARKAEPERGGGALLLGLLAILVLAACVGAGAVASHIYWPQPGPLAIQGGAVTMAGELDGALTNGVTGRVGPVMVDMTFKTKAGHYCRAFHSVPDALAGVACRASDHWLARTITAYSPPPPVQPPAPGQPPLAPAVAATIEATIDGPPLDPAAEGKARAGGWKL